MVKGGLATVAVLLAVLADAAGGATTRLDADGTVLVDSRKVFPIVLAKGPEGGGVEEVAAAGGAGTRPVTISGLPETVRTGTVYTEGRTVEVTNGSFSDIFARWDVHVYRFALPAPEPPPPPPPTPLPPPPPPLETAAAPPAPRTLRTTRATSARTRRAFTLRLQLVTDQGAGVTSGVVSCGARVRNRPLRVLSRGWRSGAAYCTWSLPRSTQRRLLRGVMRISSQGLSLTHRFAHRVR